MRRRYTKALLEAAAKDCVSIAGVLRKLGVPQAGGTHAHISRKLKAFQIDTSHFLGQGANRGSGHKGPRKLPSEEVLVLRTHGTRQKAHILRRALLESGRAYRCGGAGCQVQGEWLGRPVVLHVNHRNGNWLDDRAENLEFLCPNCHSQTANYCRGREWAELTSRAKYCRELRKRQRGPVAE